MIDGHHDHVAAEHGPGGRGHGGGGPGCALGVAPDVYVYLVDHGRGCVKQSITFAPEEQ